MIRQPRRWRLPEAMVGAINQWLSPAGPRARLSIIHFHRVHEQPDPLFPLEPYRRSFEQKMRRLSRDWTVLALPQAVSLLASGMLPARALCITFDDGYADNLSVALPVLKKFRLPATFFIATGFLQGGLMWNDRLIEALRRMRAGRLDLRERGWGVFEIDDAISRRRAIDDLIGRIKYLESPARDEAVAGVVAAAGVSALPDLMLDARGVCQLARAGMSIGAHTVDHPILARLELREAADQIARSRDQLESVLQQRVGLFAYPNGKPGQDYLPEHANLLRKLGFDAGLTTAGGAATRGDDLMQLPRFTPWRPGALAFGLQLAGNLAQARRQG